MSNAIDPASIELLQEWLPQQRFFGGTAEQLAQLEIVERQSFKAAELVIARVGSENYQLWFAHGWQQATKSSGLVDVLSQGAYALPLLQELAPLLSVSAPEQVETFSGEQTNTSLICDCAAMWKFFRRLHPGINPDVELTGVLTMGEEDTAASAVPAPVPRLLGHWTDELGTLVMAQQFLAGAQDGWTLALDWPTSQVDAEAERMGQAVALTHKLLAEALPVGMASTTSIVAGFRSRLQWAAHLTPELRPFAPSITRLYDELEAHPPVPVQRIHGDLHLGQLLFDGNRWFLSDFEGEPARSWSSRKEPDSPLRDVAGMLRSFDYASATKSGAKPSASGGKDLLSSTAQFLTGYGQEMEKSSTGARLDDKLLRGYVLDKAVYECGYEILHRPDWLALPLSAIEALLD